MELGIALLSLACLRSAGHDRVLDVLRPQKVGDEEARVILGRLVRSEADAKAQIGAEVHDLVVEEMVVVDEVGQFVLVAVVFDAEKGARVMKSYSPRSAAPWGKNPNLRALSR
jgi:hypothetical protein